MGLLEVGIYLRSKLEAVKKGNAINASRNLQTQRRAVQSQILGCTTIVNFSSATYQNREVRWLRASKERDILELLVFFTVGFFVHPLVAINTPKDEGAGVDLCDISFR